MSFHPSVYPNFVAEDSVARSRLFLQYQSPRNDFDLIVIGSGMGGGILADELADRAAGSRRILVLEAGAFLYPTHVFNICRFPNADVARHFGVDNFWRHGGSASSHYIHERPQMNFGGRSIFWSGLIPMLQPWELEFFPPQVRADLGAGHYLDEAGERMNESRTMGTTARAIVDALRLSPLGQDFVIEETPRALHQPYLTREGQARDQFFVEPSGVFNTAELLINQAGLTPGVSHGDGPGLHLLLNHFVEDVQRHHDGRLQLVVRNCLNGQIRFLQAGTVILVGGSIESPKLLRRSSLFPTLPASVRAFAGRGLTDHPTTDWIDTHVTHLGPVAIPRDAHAKIVFYSREHRDAGGRILYPFNVEMNLNHEYWHLRENDPNALATPITATGDSILEIKFSFGNCLDDGNQIKDPPPFQYVPEIVFRNQNWIDHLAGSRFPALAGWQKSHGEIFDVLNDVTLRIFSQFQRHGSAARPFTKDGREIWFGDDHKDFGLGTVHHAIGTLRMPFRQRYDAPFQGDSVVDENLQVVGAPGLYACDMSVMPFSAAVNPVRALAALALRLARRLTP